MATESVTHYFDFKKILGGNPSIDSLTSGNDWAKCQEWAFKAMRSELEHGWRVDQESFGPHSFKYHEIGTGWDTGQWIAYILVGLITWGIGFFVLPFLMKGGRKLALDGFKVRLER